MSYNDNDKYAFIGSYGTAGRTTSANPKRVLIQKYDGLGAFNRSWYDFKVGFNDSVGNFWLGNDMISTLTTTTSCNRLTFELQVDNRVFGTNF